MKILLIAAAVWVLCLVLAAGGGIALIGAWLKARPCSACCGECEAFCENGPECDFS